MPVDESADIISRFTNLPSLLDILTSKQLTLLDPRKWDDKNDAYSISHYMAYKGLKTLLALCFTEARETYHHWRIYAGDVNGVCIRIRKKAVFSSISKEEGFRFEKVVYRSYSQLEGESFLFEKLPFLKRAGYTDEDEYRLIYVNEKERVAQKRISIDISMIDHIYINPWLPPPLVESLKMTIANIAGDSFKRKVSQSRLIKSSKWKGLVDLIEPN